MQLLNVERAYIDQDVRFKWRTYTATNVRRSWYDTGAINMVVARRLLIFLAAVHLTLAQRGAAQPPKLTRGLSAGISTAHQLLRKDAKTTYTDDNDCLSFSILGSD